MEQSRVNENTFENISHQELAISLLLAAIKKNRIAPAYLFTGPKGVGQKEVALRFLEALTRGICCL